MSISCVLMPIASVKSFTTMQKNASGKIIILYDEDERIASQAATTMCERGIENLFMLSGGESDKRPIANRSPSWKK